MNSLGFILKIIEHVTDSISCDSCGKVPVVASVRVTEIIKLSEFESALLNKRILKPVRRLHFNCGFCLVKTRLKYPIAGKRKPGRNC
jgi:hypothetical protein